MLLGVAVQDGEDEHRPILGVDRAPRWRDRMISDTELLRKVFSGVHPSVLEVRDQGLPRDGDLVDPLEPVDGHRLLEAELPEDGGHLGDERRAVESHELGVRPGRIYQGPHEVEYGPRPRSFLTAATFFIAGWKEGANMNPIPICSIDSLTRDDSMPRLNPSFSRTSALPDLLVTDRPPCFATVAPAPAATNADIVLTLGVLTTSPPVPHMSTILPLTEGRPSIVP